MNRLTEAEINYLVEGYICSGEYVLNQNDVDPIIHSIHTVSDWNSKWLEIAKYAESERRNMNAAYYYVLSMKLLNDNSKQKNSIIEKAMTNFYKGFDKLKINYKLYDIPYSNESLSCIQIKAKNQKYVIIITCSYETYAEEYVLLAYYLSIQGYTCIIIEGPGQGSSPARNLYGTSKSEVYINTTLNYFHLECCCILGMYSGGYFAMRAAMYDRRIKYLLLVNPLCDLMAPLKCFNHISKFYMLQCLRCLKCSKLISYFMDKATSNLAVSRPIMEHYCYIHNKKNYYDFLTLIMNYELKNDLPLITQDVGILYKSGESPFYKEHFNFIRDNLENANSIITNIIYPSTETSKNVAGTVSSPLYTGLTDWLNNNIHINSDN